jgi:hypothetical protein
MRGPAAPLLVVLASACSSGPSAATPSDASVASDAADASTRDGAEDVGPDDTGSPDETGSPGDDASCDRQSDASFYYAVIDLDNALCSPVELPCGCRILFDGVTGGCSQPGLTPAALDDDATLLKLAQEHDASLPAGSICALQELPPSATPGGGCADDSAAGWCFVQGSCPSDASPKCAQAACTTGGFAAAHIAYATTYLVCP